MIELGTIWTEGSVEISRIYDISINQTFNSHGTANIKAYVDNANMIRTLNEGAEIEVWRKNVNTNLLLFCGRLKECKLTAIGNKLYALNIFLVSYSIDLDREKKRRSFQDITLSYADIVKMVADCSVFVFGDKWNQMKPVAPIIQYDETDWEFIIRVASQINEMVSTDLLAKSCRIYLGNNLEMKPCQSEWQIIESGVSGKFYEHRKCSQKDFTYYLIECHDMLGLGSSVLIGENKLYVYEKMFYKEEECLKCTYYLGNAIFLQQEIKFNQGFIGRVIKGEVLETKNETLKIKMEIDKNQSKDTAYSYDWKPETGDLMYCMPQIGTIVSLYFGDEDERTGYIINCIRTQNSICQDMDNPNNKIFTSEHGKRLVLNEKQISFSSDYKDENASSIKLQDEEGVSFYSNKGLEIIANESITVESEDAVIEGAREVVCIQGEEEGGNNSAATVTVKERVDIIAKETWLETREIYEYPNILDTIEEVKRDSLVGKVLLGIGTAVCVALIGAVIVTCGAAIIATAGIASAAIASIGYTAIFSSAFIGGTVAGIAGVGVEAYSDYKKGNTDDYGDYMSIAAANSGASALTGGISAPVNEAIELANVPFKMWLAAKIGLGASDSGVSYMLSQSFLGEQIDTTDLNINMLVGAIFNLNGRLIDELIDGEREMGEALVDAYADAYMSGTHVGSRAYKEYYSFVEKSKSLLNGQVPEEVYSWMVQMNNLDAMLSNVFSNSLKSTRSMMELITNDDSLMDDEKEKLIQAYKNEVLSRVNFKNQYYIVRGAVLKCSKGSHHRRMDLNRDSGMRSLSGEYPHPYVNETQCVVGECENIKFFGLCQNCKEGKEICVMSQDNKEKIVGIKCEPDLLGSVWMNTKEDGFVQAEKLVSSMSYLMCRHGGCITVLTSGEEYCGELDDGEINCWMQNEGD